MKFLFNSIKATFLAILFCSAPVFGDFVNFKASKQVTQENNNNQGIVTQVIEQSQVMDQKPLQVQQQVNQLPTKEINSALKNQETVQTVQSTPDKKAVEVKEVPKTENKEVIQNVQSAPEKKAEETKEVQKTESVEKKDEVKKIQPKSKTEILVNNGVDGVYQGWITPVKKFFADDINGDKSLDEQSKKIEINNINAAIDIPMDLFGSKVAYPVAQAVVETVVGNENLSSDGSNGMMVQTAKNVTTGLIVNGTKSIYGTALSTASALMVQAPLAAWLASKGILGFYPSLVGLALSFGADYFTGNGIDVVSPVMTVCESGLTGLGMLGVSKVVGAVVGSKARQALYAADVKTDSISELVPEKIKQNRWLNNSVTRGAIKFAKLAALYSIYSHVKSAMTGEAAAN